MDSQGKRLAKVAARPKLADEIAETLRQAILRGVYEPDAKLGMEELADELGVSIMPVREALITLGNEGLVRAEPRRSFRANPLSRKDLDDIVEVQSYLAGMLAARAAEQATREDIAELRRLHDEFTAAAAAPAGEERSSRLNELNEAFHGYINRIPSGERVRWFLRLTNRFVRRDLFDSVPGFTEGVLADHPLLIEALAKGDAAEGRRIMQEHFLQGSKLMSQAEAAGNGPA